ncbi:sll0787 family AIR synthase-like protein [Stenomitos frigidus]|uniref:sll0787 family AIR synthase-like protein n=1 Tax=Stenomitos frigidus TaxID=1886765 RepID=UPI001FE6DBC8|nr:sll0787 family AIR synthase-like protein [Stenomitos frigidus]
MKLAELTAHLQQSLGILHKQDIQAVARRLGEVGGQQSAVNGQNKLKTSFSLSSGQTQNSKLKTQNFPSSPSSPTSSSPHPPSRTLLGDDCAAIPDGSGYLLMAAEGMLPSLVETEPWFAGWCAVMVNVSDIYAMGGRPIAVVDTLWSQAKTLSDSLLDGMRAASEVYGVPIVGGHTNGHSHYNALSVAILGRATQLLTSFDAQPGDRLLIATDFRGKPHPKHPFWNAATTADPVQLRGDLALLPYLAESGLCQAGKDISMGGIVGTLLMLLETSNCGAVLHLDAVPCPPEMLLERWLLCFPSYGFLLSVRPENVDAVRSLFHQRDLICEAIGDVQATPQLILKHQEQTAVFWDLAEQSLTGFAPVK